MTDDNYNKLPILYADTMVVMTNGDVTDLRRYNSHESYIPALSFVNRPPLGILKKLDIRKLCSHPNHKVHSIQGIAECLSDDSIQHEIKSQFSRNLNRQELTAQQLDTSMFDINKYLVKPAIPSAILAITATTEQQREVSLEATYDSIIKSCSNILRHNAKPSKTASQIGAATREKYTDIGVLLYNSLPTIYQNIIEDSQISIAIAENLSNLGFRENDHGQANLPSRLINLKLGAYPNDKNCLVTCALLEEFTHIIDNDLGFSKQDGWLRAVQLDKQNAGHQLESFFKKTNKNVAADDSSHDKLGSFGYDADQIPLELLADLFVIDHTRVINAEEKKSIKAAIPNMWAEYEVFLEQVERYPDIMTEKRTQLKAQTDTSMKPRFVRASAPELLKRQA